MVKKIDNISSGKINLLTLIFMLVFSMAGLCQNYTASLIYVDRPNQRSGSSLDIELTIDGKIVGILKNNQSFLIQTYEQGFHKLNGRILKNGKPFTAGNVSIKSAYVDQNSEKVNFSIGLIVKSKDLILSFNPSSIVGSTENGNSTITRRFQQTNEGNRFNEVSEFSKIPTIELQRSSANLKSEEVIFDLIQPQVNEGDVFVSHEAMLTVKGSFNQPGLVKNIYVNGAKVEVRNDGYFSIDLKIPFKSYDIEIVYLLTTGILKTFSFISSRPFGEEAQAAKPEVRAGTDYALLFATNQYQEFNNLSNPIFDATTIASELNEKYGFEVEKVINPSLVDILTKLKSYAKKMYSDDDQLLIFFAGHGEYDKFFKQGYVLAKDSKSSDEGRVSYMSHADLRNIINNIPCEHIFLTLDVCFGGTFDPLVASRGTPAYQAINKESYIKRKMAHKTRLYITSGGKTYVPDGRPGHHSPFARRFIEALRGFGGEDGILTFNELVSYTEKVSPEPHYGEFGMNEPGSDFLFIYKPN